MKQHILLEKANHYDYKRSNIIPNNASYDSTRGFWTMNNSDVLYMKSPYALNRDSKKCDIETGEDQKGE